MTFAAELKDLFEKYEVKFDINCGYEETYVSFYVGGDYRKPVVLTSDADSDGPKIAAQSVKF